MSSDFSDISVVLTVHDKEPLIARVAQAILRQASPAVRELVVVFDGCKDRSEEAFDKAVASAPFPGRVKIVKAHAPDVWEVRANNIGLRLCTGSAVILFQDDMVVREPGYDQRLIKPLRAFQDVFAVTARSAHNDILVDGELTYTDLLGRDNPTGLPVSRWEKRLRRFFRRPRPLVRDVFGVRDIVNRGPLLLHRARAESLGFFDEAFAPLDLDDHDLCFRAFRDHGWVCGSYPVAYDSDDAWSSTRTVPSSGKVWRESHAKNKKILVERHADLMRGPKHNENRKLA